MRLEKTQTNIIEILKTVNGIYNVSYNGFFEKGYWGNKTTFSEVII